MPTYRLIFPTPEGTAIENAETAMIDSGDMLYDVGAEIEHDRQALAGQPGPSKIRRFARQPTSWSGLLTRPV
jgi:hypothetical protein